MGYAGNIVTLHDEANAYAAGEGFQAYYFPKNKGLSFKIGEKLAG